MTLSRIFVPFFTEMLLLNMMGTINTLMLSHYSDDAVAAVGSATQLLGMKMCIRDSLLPVPFRVSAEALAVPGIRMQENC